MMNRIILTMQNFVESKIEMSCKINISWKMVETFIMQIFLTFFTALDIFLLKRDLIAQYICYKECQNISKV